MLYKEFTDRFIEYTVTHRLGTYAIMDFAELEQYTKVYAVNKVAKELRDELRYDDNNTVLVEGRWGEETTEVHFIPPYNDIIQIAEKLVDKYYENTDVLFPIDEERVINECLLDVLDDMDIPYETRIDEYDDEDEYDF